MTDLEALAVASASSQAAAIAARDISSEELTRAYLERIARHNPGLNAVVTIDERQALAEARQRDADLAAGAPAGPLHGLPITVKDALAVKGLRSTGGVPRLKDHVPDRDAAAVARIRAAGAVILGKTNMPTANADTQSRNPIFGVSNNPWDRMRTPGGSVGGGGAAVAAGMSSLELGSEIAGSLRNPAHFNGIYGHKTSFGLVPMTGHIPPGPDPAGRQVTEIDLVCGGGLARSPGDLELLLRSIAGPAPDRAAAWRVAFRRPRATQLSDFRVALWLDDPFVPLDIEVSSVLDDLVTRLEAAGASIDRTPSLPVTLEESHREFEALMFAAFGGDPYRSTISRKSTYFFLRSVVRNPRGPAARVRGLIEQKHPDWLRHDRRRYQIRDRWHQFFRSYDILLMPVTSTVAPPHHDKDHDVFGRVLIVNGQPRNYFEQLVWNGVANLAGLPATAAPAGFARSGLPVGVQAMGPPSEDLTTIEFARRLEETVGGYVPPPAYSPSQPLSRTG